MAGGCIDCCMGPLAASQAEKQRGKNNRYVFISLCSTGRAGDLQLTYSLCNSRAPQPSSLPLPILGLHTRECLWLPHAQVARPPPQGTLQEADGTRDSWSPRNSVRQLAEPLISSDPRVPVHPNPSTVPCFSISEDI